MQRVQIVVAVGAFLVAGAAGLWFDRGASPTIPVEIGTTGPAVDAGDRTQTVHVSGAVRHPGLVVVPDGARVAEAVAQAGGMLPSADPAALNLAALVADGQQIVVPTVGDAPAPSGVDDGGLIRVNSASAEQLEQLPGVGPVLAARIVQFRESNGPFAAVEDLLDVPGIGEGKLASLRDLVAIP